MHNTNITLAFILFSAGCAATAPNWAQEKGPERAPAELASAPTSKKEDNKVRNPVKYDSATIEKRTMHLIKAQRYDEAVRLLTAVCAEDPAVGCYLLGDLMLQLESKDARSQALVFLEGACRAGSGPACNRLATVMEDAGPKYASRARRLYRRGCKLGDPTSCDSLGRMMRFGLGGPKDVESGVQLELKACVAGLATACSNLGHAFRTGDGVPRDEKRGAELYALACQGGAAAGCANLAYLHEAGIGVNAHPGRALELRTKACGGGHAVSCRVVADHLKKSDNPNEARLFYEKSCALEDAHACHWRGLLESSPERQTEWFRKGCELGDGESCERLAETHLKGSNDWVEAMEKACESGLGRGCAHLAHVAFGRDQTGVTLRYGQKACGLDSGWGCALVAQTHLKQGDELAARRALDRGCGLDYAWACGQLASAYAEKPWGGVQSNPERALELSAKACRLAPETECAGHASHLSDPHRSKAEVERGLGIFRRRCEQEGDSSSCNGAAWVLATSRFRALRDGRRAIRYASRAIQLEPKDASRAMYYDTLAAAYARAGQFRSAIRQQRRSIYLVTRHRPEIGPWLDDELVRMRARLARYRRGQAYVNHR